MATLNLAQHHADVAFDADELRQHLTSRKIPSLMAGDILSPAALRLSQAFSGSQVLAKYGCQKRSLSHISRI